MTGPPDQHFFWQSAYFQTRQRAYFFSFLALVILIVAGWNSSNFYENYLRQEVQEEFAMRVNSLSSALTQSINRRLALISGLSSFIETELSQTEQLKNEMIAQIAADLYGNTEGILNIAVVPGGVMQCVYPYDENKIVLVQGPARDERPNVPPGMQRTTNTGNIILSQPMELFQGVQGIIVRQTIYEDNNYWGITNFNVAILPMLEEAGLLSAQSEMALALKDQTGQIFYGSEDVFASDAVTFTIHLPEGTWELAGTPIDGWRKSYQTDLWVYWSLCLILVMTLTILIYQYTRSDKYLSILVERRTRDLQESETQYRELANNALVGIYIIQNQVIQFGNQGLADLFGYQSPEEIVGIHIQNLVLWSSWDKVEKEVQKRENGQKENSRYRFKGVRTDGSVIDIESLGVYITHQGDPAVQGVLIDITKRVQADVELKQYTLQLEALREASLSLNANLSLQAVLDALLEFVLKLVPAEDAHIFNYDGKDLHFGAVLWADGRQEEPFAEPRQNGLTYTVARSGKRIVVNDMSDSSMFQDWPLVGAIVGLPLLRNEQVVGVMNVAINNAHEFSSSELRILELLADQAAIAIVNARLYEEVQRHVNQLETLNTVNSALSTSLELGKVLELILDQIGKVLPLDRGAIILHERDALRVMIDRGNSPSSKGIIFSAEDELYQELQHTRRPVILNHLKDDPRFQSWGQSTHIASWMGVPLIVRDNLIGFLTIDSNQTDVYSPEQAELALPFAAQAAQAIENARQFNAAQRRMEKLDALHKIDQAITSSFNLKVTLNILLDQLRTQLGVDAAVIMCYEDALLSLTYCQGQGFRTSALQHANLPLGSGHAGKVALQRKSIYIPDINHTDSNLLISDRFQNEGFVAYYGVPLIAKGMLIGVLEILHRSALDPDDEWVDFLQVLAEQAAIAMDNIDLFDNLQSSNMNLLMAYDATIEGWARALELRDMETEGHSRRTVTLTMDLAAMLGIREEDMMHIRRGALLHDIGKMGVSDAILQKPGKLTDEEWQIMRQHPVYAYDWLSSIEYLRPALDIPYFHHEKWDGSGYPRGLKGEQIPLAARIFAVVDVWDALLSDRPYRNAWSKERTLTYIQEQAGQHFDPRVVDVFLKKVMIKSSIGVSQFPQAGDDMDTLTKLAEPAMYPEKTEKSKIKIFGTLVNPNGHR